MEKNIQIFDNIYSKQFISDIENLLLNPNSIQKFPWFFSSNITDSTSKNSNPGFFHEFQKNNNISSKYYFKISQILYQFCNHINKDLKEIICSRCFLDLPSPNPGPDLPPHTDLSLPHLVLLYYVNDSEGDTIFFKEDKITEIERVSPKKGRIVVFDGSIPHCGTRINTSVRSAINFNFII